MKVVHLSVCRRETDDGQTPALGVSQYITLDSRSAVHIWPEEEGVIRDCLAGEALARGMTISPAVDLSSSEICLIPSDTDMSMWRVDMYVAAQVVAYDSRSVGLM